MDTRFLICLCIIIQQVRAYSTFFECETCLAAYSVLYSAFFSGMSPPAILEKVVTTACHHREAFTLDVLDPACIHYEHGICKLYTSEQTQGWSTHMANPFEITFDMSSSSPSLTTHVDELTHPEQLQPHIQLRHGYIAQFARKNKAQPSSTLCRQLLSDIVKNPSFPIQMKKMRMCQGDKCDQQFCSVMPVASLSLPHCSLQSTPKRMRSFQKRTKERYHTDGRLETRSGSSLTRQSSRKFTAPAASTHTTITPNNFKVSVIRDHRGRCESACQRHLLQQGKALSQMFHQMRKKRKGGKGGFLKWLVGLWEALKSSSTFQNAMRKENMQQALRQGSAMVRDSLRNFNP